jgi:hypothetical protein
MISFFLSNIFQFKCTFPKLDIESRTPSYTQPRVQTKNDLFSLNGITIINCNTTLANQKKWLIFKVDEKTGQDSEEILLNIETNPSINYAELVIQPQTFTHGLYRFVFTSTLVSEMTSFSQIDTFVKIVPSGLVLSTLSLSKPMYGSTIEITRGLNQTIKFNPYLYTYDIDSMVVIRELTFKYACQVIDLNIKEGFPKMPATNKTIYLNEFKSNSNLVSLLKCFNSIGDFIDFF